MSEEYDHYLSFLLMGNNHTGKTSLLRRYVEETYDDNYFYFPADFKIKNLDRNGKKIKVQIWNTRAQRFTHTLIRAYYKRANGILLIYDITYRQSFDDINLWLNDIKDKANKNTVILLVGNKCDLENEREVSFQEGKDFADNNGIKFIETSTKMNLNVDEAFEIVVDEVIKNNKDILDNERRIVLTKKNVYKKKVGGCC